MTDRGGVVTFGPNEWFVDEQYRKFVRDPDLVETSWREFFATYTPPAAGTAPQPEPESESGPAEPHETPSAATPSEQMVNASTAAAPVVPTPGAPSAPTPEVPAATEDEGPLTPPAPMPEARANEPTPKSRPGQAAHPTVPRDLAPPGTHKPVTATAPVAEPVAVPATAYYAQRTESLRPLTPTEAHSEQLRGPAARIVTNMEASLTVPTATSVRSFPARLLQENRVLINEHLARTRGGKVSFTHLLAAAIVEALADVPAMNTVYELRDGKPTVATPAHVNLGVAIDLTKSDGSRALLVPNIKAAETLDFAAFVAAYDDIVRRARSGKLQVDDFTGTTISVTNPGTIGTQHSVPRLMAGQSAIIGVGSLEYPAEYSGASEEQLGRFAVSKVVTLTSTYDHRIIQGAQSGEFLRAVGSKLIGEDGFYDRVFAALRVPYQPWRWVRDNNIDADADAAKPARIAALIHSYRSRGHLMADIDPLGYRQRSHPDLDIASHGLTIWDLDRTFPVPTFETKPKSTLRDVLTILRDAYVRTVGVEYMHIADRTRRTWLSRRLESGYSRTSRPEQMEILRKLNAAEAFETFLQTKFVGQKRFSLEGGEALIPMLDAVLSSAAREGLHEVVIGMSHRGRLNVLSNLAGKSYAQIFREFEGATDPRSVHGSGDVKYHLGTEGTYTAPNGDTTTVTLAANPSHLEAVDPVVEGIVRAKQDRIDLGGEDYTVLPVIVHGDAAFAGQGVVAETLNLSNLRGYRTGGTIHVVVNNQIGFTTGSYASRSTTYCTDIAKGYQTPIFHVNGDDPEACVRVALLAFAYRTQFKSDVVIDLICYRRRGHNEGDDPSMTQPLMYNLIEGKRSVRTLYTSALLERGDITEDEAEAMRSDYQDQLERVFTESKSDADVPAPGRLELPESQREGAGEMVGWQTAVPPWVLERIGRAHLRRPEGFNVHAKLEPLLAKREQMSREGGIDWGFAEILAFGSLLLERTNVRLAGQDSRRGTFVQRHAVLHDRATGAEWTPLQALAADQGKFFVYDSALSEYSALGFEYGYSIEDPEALVLWEAQFGDFANGAQTIIDEFVSSAAQKWDQQSSLVLLLPHGYEGQGPDHSSARIERYLTLAAEDNMTVAMPSTPASYFHLLRRQAYATPRTPLIVATPKSMLRHKDAVSAVEDFTTGSFRPVIGDTVDPGGVRRVLLCAGKIYYDLAAHRGDDASTAIVRLEQYYPLDVDAVREALAPYDGAEVVWVQDEPQNQGAWPFMALNLFPALSLPAKVVARKASASPATGSGKVHAAQQADLIRAAFEPLQ